MTLFKYKAKKDTQTVAGQIEARNKEEAVELINQKGLIPISVQQYRQGKSGVTDKRFSVRKSYTKELFVFSRQLGNMLKAGVPLLRALGTVEEQTNDPKFKEVLSSIYQKIKDGEAFSDSLSGYPNIFSSLYVAMVRAGEEGGDLKEMLFRLAEHQKSQQELFSKIRSAIAYPIMMCVVGIATVFFILTFVMPKITDLFERNEGNLPIPTQIVMNLSDFLQSGWMIILIVVLFLIFAIKKWLELSKNRAVVDEMILKLPFFGELILKTELLRFCRTLELLLESGTPLQKALDIVVPILNNERIKMDLSACKKDLEAGLTMGDSLRNSKIIPAMMVNLISIGEESGSPEESLKDISDSYEQETGELIKTTTSLLEPAMILFVGLIVGFIVISMLLPIFQMDVLAQ